ncbi:MAG: TQO small subunit DoxD [bacterium]
MKHYIIEESPISHLLFNNTKVSWFWLIVRLYVGYEWAMAGWEKVISPAWVGTNAGGAITGFLNNALTKSIGLHPDVHGWYAVFLQNVILSNPALWSNIIAWGELAVGIALIVGAFSGVAAFFGLFMNLNYLLAGTVSTNPILFTLSIGLILAWKVAGYIGLDRFILPRFGVFLGKEIEKKA